MHNRAQAIIEIKDFLQSDERCMLLTGTHQYEKHKLIMRILNEELANHLILFRTNSMQNIIEREFIGWTGLKKNLKAGERIKIGKNLYECDSFNTSSTWYKGSNKFSCAIVYPIDYICKSQKFQSIDNLFEHKNISKIFLVSWTENRLYDYSILSKYFNRHVIYDAEEEDPAYHKRVLQNI